jgi:hypothetical protein
VPASNSSVRNRSLATRTVEWLSLARIAVGHSAPLDEVQKEVEEYLRLSELHSLGIDEGSKVIEIGFGAKPLRLALMLRAGMDVEGIDLDYPVLASPWTSTLRIARRNGLERAAKSFVRYWLLDRRYWREVASHAGAPDVRYVIPPRHRLLVMDAARPEAWERWPDDSISLVTSEDVFEHIPREDIPSVLSSMHRKMRDGALALIRPNVFTGITGGHLVDWYNDAVGSDKPKRNLPWAHLRGDGVAGNTYLNRLSRAEYRDLFSRKFEIVEEIVKHPNLGRNHMTPELREQLGDWSDEELFSNQVLWVLRKRQDQRAAGAPTKDS